MKNEIKEILEYKENPDYKRLSIDEIIILQDYISNLQQRIYKARKMIFDNYGLLDKYEIEILDDILKGE